MIKGNSPEPTLPMLCATRYVFTSSTRPPSSVSRNALFARAIFEGWLPSRRCPPRIKIILRHTRLERWSKELEWKEEAQTFLSVAEAILTLRTRNLMLHATHLCTDYQPTDKLGNLGHLKEEMESNIK